MNMISKNPISDWVKPGRRADADLKVDPQHTEDVGVQDVGRLIKLALVADQLVEQLKLPRMICPSASSSRTMKVGISSGMVM